MKRLLLSPKAVSDLEAIIDYIALDSPKAAVAMLDRFERVTKHLSEFPGTGARRPAIAADFRGFAMGSYLILYRDIGDGIEVVRFVHGARNLKDI